MRSFHLPIVATVVGCAPDKWGAGLFPQIAKGNKTQFVVLLGKTPIHTSGICEMRNNKQVQRSK